MGGYPATWHVTGGHSAQLYAENGAYPYYVNEGTDDARWCIEETRATAFLTQSFMAQSGDMLSFDCKASGPYFDRDYYSFSVNGDITRILDDMPLHCVIPITSSGQVTLQFVARSMGGSMPSLLWVDNVYITPEPSTLVLLGAAAIGLVAFAWRRRTKAL